MGLLDKLKATFGKKTEQPKSEEWDIVGETKGEKADREEEAARKSEEARQQAKQAKEAQEKAEKAKQDRAERVRKAVDKAVEASKKITLNEQERAVLKEHKARPSHIYVEEQDSIHKERVINWKSEYIDEVTKHTMVAEKKAALKEQVKQAVLKELEKHEHKDSPEHLDKLVQGLVGKHLQTATKQAAPSTPKTPQKAKGHGQTRG